MNVMTSAHPFLDGRTKRMLIGGKWLEAASGKNFATHNPATGEILAQVAEGDAEDIDRAVAAHLLYVVPTIASDIGRATVRKSNFPRPVHHRERWRRGLQKIPAAPGPGNSRSAAGGEDAKR